MGNKALLAYMIAGIMNPDLVDVTDMSIDEVSKPVMPPPKGTKEYFFNKDGEFSTEQMLKTECVYKCVAINDKNAIRKFNNFMKENPSK